MGSEILHIDAAFLERLAAGDEVAFTVLFDQYKDKLYSLVWNITHSFEVADDVLQEVFLKIWLNRSELQTIENLHGYLVVTTRRVILNELRRLGRIRNRENTFRENLSHTSFDDVVDKMQEKQYAALLQKGVQQLPKQQAEVFRLIKQEGYSREDAANALQISPETVKKHLERGMRSLRAFLLTHLDEPFLWIIIMMYL